MKLETTMREWQLYQQSLVVMINQVSDSHISIPSSFFGWQGTRTRTINNRSVTSRSQGSLADKDCCR